MNTLTAALTGFVERHYPTLGPDEFAALGTETGLGIDTTGAVIPPDAGRAFATVRFQPKTSRARLHAIADRHEVTIAVDVSAKREIS